MNLLKLDLVLCTEKFDHVGLGGRVLRKKRSASALSSNIVEQYKKREAKHSNLRLFEFFHLKENKIEPGRIKHWKKVKKKPDHVMVVSGAFYHS